MKFSLPSPSRRLALALLLGCVLCLTYFITFNGIPKANDELWLADTTQNIALRGKMMYTQTQYLRTGGIASHLEPLQPVLAAPLYWIAYHVRWAGNIHALYLFNPLVTALTAIALFYAALWLGYKERTALIAGLLFGLASMAWPYTRTFFREPLAELVLLAAVALWDRWRRSFSTHEPRHWWWFGAATAATALALLGKDATIFALPLLALTAWPGMSAVTAGSKRDRTLIAVAGAIVLLGAAAILLTSLKTSSATSWTVTIQRLWRTTSLGLPYMLPGISGMLISPGRGFLWFSPVLLLALASPALLPRARWRESWLILGTTVFFAAAYAIARKDLWFGGAGWGARFMLPMLPILILAALPAIERMLDSARLWPKIALGALAALGVLVQIVGVYVDIYDYSDYLEKMTGQQSWLGPGIWDPRWSQIIGGLLYMPVSRTDMRWLTNGIDWMALAVLGAAAAAAGFALWRAWRGEDQPGRLVRVAMMAGPALVVVMAGFVLWRSMPDDRYKESSPQIEALRGDLQAEAGPRDVVMLSNYHYVSYFMNTFKGAPIWWGLPNAPGERFSPEQPAAVTSDKLEDVVGTRVPVLINRSLQGGAGYTGHSIWVVGDASPFLTWATRPAEWYLAQHGYFVSEKDYASNARLTQFLSLRAPNANQAPAIPLGAMFGPSIRLVGADVAAGPKGASVESLHAGESLGLSLLWESVGAVSTDYTVAVHLIKDGTTVVAQQDRQPVEGFAPTSKWKPGDKIRDNFGFVLPEDIAPGKYELWVTIYSWPSLEKLKVGGADHAVVATVVVK